MNNLNSPAPQEDPKISGKVSLCNIIKYMKKYTLFLFVLTFMFILNFNFVNAQAPTTLAVGDVNGDGSITCADATMISQSVVGMITLTADQRIRADVSGDGTISAYDAALLAQRNNLNCSTSTTPPHPDGSLIINIPGENNPRGVYLIENGKRRPISSAEIFTCLGYSWNAIVAANAEDAKLAVGNGLTCATQVPPSTTAHHSGSLVLGLSNQPGSVWLIKDGQRLLFPSAEVFMSNGYKWSSLVAGNSADEALPVGSVMTFAPGSLVRESSNLLKVYVVYPDKIKRGFATYAVFQAMGYRLDMTYTHDLTGYTEGEPITSVIAHSPGTDIIQDQTIFYRTATGRLGYPSLDVYNTWHSLTNDFSKIVSANDLDMSLPYQGLVPARAAGQ